MKCSINGLLLFEGAVRRVTFSEIKARAFVELEGDSRLVAEFRNGKKPRADHVRKLKLEKGERVVVIGTRSGSSQAYLFGYDIQREGKVSSGDYLMMKGVVRKLIRFKDSGIICMESDRKKKMVKASSELLRGVREGQEVSCLCYQNTCRECTGLCDEWNPKKCSACDRRMAEKRITALSLEGV